MIIIGVRYILIAGELIGLERLGSTQFLPADAGVVTGEGGGEREEKNSLNQIKKSRVNRSVHSAEESFTRPDPLAVYVLEFESDRCRRRRLHPRVNEKSS